MKGKATLSPAEQRMDFAAWVDDAVPVIEKHGPEWICTCPKCDREKLAVNVKRKAFRCFVCHFGGWSPLRLIEETLNVGPARAELVVEQYGSGRLGLSPRVGELGAGPDLRHRTGPPPVAPPPPGTIWHLNGPAASYAAGRGIPWEHAQWFGLTSCYGDNSRSKADRMTAGRLIVPVWDASGAFVYWTARDTTGQSKAKLINLPASCNDPLTHPPDCVCKHLDWGLPPVPQVAGKSEVLVGLHLIQPGSRVVIVEGPIDAVVCGPGFVATQGADLSIEQAALLVQRGVTEAVVMFDPDEAGQAGTETALATLSPLLPTRVAECPAGYDPALLGRAVALELADRAGSRPAVVALGQSPETKDRPAVRKPVIPLVGPL